jgi:DNA-binding MurR/RpiR family transcriptional regulator
MLTGCETSTEKNIYNFCLSEPKKIYHMTINELADCCFTTPSTISKYIKKSELENFYDFKSYFYNNFYIKIDVSNNNLLSFKKKITNSIDSIKYEEINQAGLAISQAQEIIIFGVGSSGYICGYLKNNLLRLGIKVLYEKSFYTCLDQIYARPPALVILVSHSAKTDVVEKIVNSIDEKSSLIAITSNENSALYKRANLKVKYIDKTIDGSLFANNSMVIQSLIADLILDDVSKRIKGKYKFNIAK